MDYTFISRRLYTLLEQHDITEYELSMQLGRCRSYINKITSNKTLPSMKGFFEICDYFQITPGFRPEACRKVSKVICWSNSSTGA